MSLQNYLGKINPKKLSSMSPVRFFLRYIGGTSKSLYEDCCKAPSDIFFPEYFCLIFCAVKLLMVGLPLLNNVYQEMEKVPHCAGLTGIPKENMDGP